MLLDVFLFLLGMAVVKGIVEPIVASQTQRFVLKYLPFILDSLDPVMPDYMATLSPEELQRVIESHVLNYAPSLSAGDREKLFQEFIRRYDPIVNSSKVGKQNGKIKE